MDKKIYKCFNVILELLEERGFRVPMVYRNMTITNFNYLYSAQENNLDINLNSKNGSVYVKFLFKIKSVDNLDEVNELLLKKGYNKRILVVCDEDWNKVKIDKMNNTYIKNCSLFYYKYISINLIKNSLVPRHEKLNTLERDELVSSLKILNKNIPILNITDPISKYYGYEINDIIKIHRNVQNNSYSTYRIVKYVNKNERNEGDNEEVMDIDSEDLISDFSDLPEQLIIPDELRQEYKQYQDDLKKKQEELKLKQKDALSKKRRQRRQLEKFNSLSQIYDEYVAYQIENKSSNSRKILDINSQCGIIPKSDMEPGQQDPSEILVRFDDTRFIDIIISQYIVKIRCDDDPWKIVKTDPALLTIENGDGRGLLEFTSTTYNDYIRLHNELIQEADVISDRCPADAERSERMTIWEVSPKQQFVVVWAKLFDNYRNKITNFNITRSPEIELPISGTDRTLTFELIGIIVHIGRSNNSGHYIAVIKCGEVWYECDDLKADVIRVDIDNAKYNDSYMSFYKLKGIANNNMMPINFVNNGDTCYLNSLLQNYVNIRNISPELFV